VPTGTPSSHLLKILFLCFFSDHIAMSETLQFSLFKGIFHSSLQYTVVQNIPPKLQLIQTHNTQYTNMVQTLHRPPLCTSYFTSIQFMVFKISLKQIALKTQSSSHKHTIHNTVNNMAIISTANTLYYHSNVIQSASHALPDSSLSGMVMTRPTVCCCQL